MFMILAALSTPSLGAVIKETTSWHEIEAQVRDPGTLVVTDLDDTVMQSAIYLGSIAWSEAVIADLMAKGLSKPEAERMQTFTWGSVQAAIPIRTVDPETPAILAQLQDRRIPMIG